MNPFSRTIINGVLDRGRSLPSKYRLFYSRTPNNWLDVGWEGDFGWDSELSTWLIPRTVVDWTGATRDMFTILGGGLFFDSAGNSLSVTGTQILAWSGINKYHILFSLTKGLVIYDPYAVTDVVIVKADKFMRQPVYSDIPTVFLNGCDITGSSGFDSGILGTNPGQWVPDHLGNLVNAGVDVPAIQGMRLEWVPSQQELVTNGTFDTDTGWTKGPGWTIDTADSNNAIATSTASNLECSLITLAGKSYRVIYKVDNLSGELRCRFAGTANVSGLIRTTNGTFTEDIVATSNNTLFRIIPVTSLTCTIDNISVQELIPTWKDTKLDGTPILPSTLQPTRTFDAGFTTSTPGPTFKRYTRANPAVDIPGYLSEPARTNKCTCRKANPVDTTGITGVYGSPTITLATGQGVRIAAAKLGNICTLGNLYKVTGTTDDKIEIAGVSNTNAHSLSAYIDVVSGGASLRFNDITRTAASGGGLSRVIAENITPSITSNIVITITAPNTEYYFILPQLEEGAFCTSPICKLQDGTDPLTTITRAGTVLSFPTLGKIRSNNQAYRMAVIPRADTITEGYIFSTYSDANNYSAIVFESGIIRWKKRIGGSNNYLPVSLPYTLGSAVEVLAVQSSSYGLNISARMLPSTTWINGTVLSTSNGKVNLPIGTTYQLGSNNSTNQFTGNISELETLDIPLGISDPLAWAKAQWGIS